MSKRKRSSPEFKREAVLLTQHPGVSKAEIARELGVNTNSLSRVGITVGEAECPALQARVLTMMRC